MSKYIIEELTSVFVNQRLVTVVGRTQLEQLQDELKFQTFGEVNDSLAQTVGKRVGAQSVITGSFEQVGNYYRFRVRVIDVDTASITVTYSTNVQNDQGVASLMGSSGTSPSVSTAVTQQENYEDFTTGQRVGTWAINACTIPGLGSYIIMKDKVGFRNQLLFGLGASLMYIVGYLTILDSTYEESVYHYSDTSYGGYGYHTYETKTDEDKLTLGYTFIAIGGILGTVNFIYNIVRSSTYHKPQSTALLFDPTAINIVLLPARDGSIDRVRLSYTMHF